MNNKIMKIKLINLNYKTIYFWFIILKLGPMKIKTFVCDHSQACGHINNIAIIYTYFLLKSKPRRTRVEDSIDCTLFPCRSLSSSQLLVSIQTKVELAFWWSEASTAFVKRTKRRTIWTTLSLSLDLTGEKITKSS